MLENLLVSYGHHFPIRRGKLRVIDSLWRAVAQGNTKRVARLKHGGLRMSCDLNQMLQRQFYFCGTYLLAEDILDCWETQAKGAATIFDVGANAGIFSLAALAIQPDAIVHAFEPTPEIAAGLRETARLNGLDRLHVQELAVARTSGRATLNRFGGEFGTNEGMNFITTAVGPSAEIVATVSLDDFCANRSIERIDLLKLDIQGNEHQALAGAANLLDAGRVGTVFAELNWGDEKETSPASESIRILEGAGYQFAVPQGDLRWRNAGEWMRSLTDVIARRVPSEGVL